MVYLKMKMRSTLEDLQDGVEIWDIRNKNQPQLITTIDEYHPHDIVRYGGYTFLADQDRAFVILDIVGI